MHPPFSCLDYSVDDARVSQNIPYFPHKLFRCWLARLVSIPRLPSPAPARAGTPEAPGRAAPRQKGRAGGGGGGSGGSGTPGGGAGRSPGRKMLGGGGIRGGGDAAGNSGKDHGEDDNDSLFGYSDDGDGDGGDDGDDGEDDYHRRRRLQNGLCVLVGVAWAAAVLLCVGGAGSASAGGAAALEVALVCAVVGAAVLAGLAYFLGLPAWPREAGPEEEGEEDRERQWWWWLRERWGRGTVDEGGKLAEIDGVTYLAI